MKIDPTDTTKKLKGVAPPAILAVGSAAGVLFLDTHPIVKNMLQGAAVAGVTKTVKVLAPTATFLNGDGLGMTPVSAVSNTDRWLYQENTPISGMGFPNLGQIQPPESGSGFYIDAPAFMQGTDNDVQFNGAEDELNGSDAEYANQIYGADDSEML